MRCGRPAITPSPLGPWAFACSAMSSSARGQLSLSLRFDRAAVIDFDVHHGNGTEAALRDDPRLSSDPSTSARCGQKQASRHAAGRVVSSLEGGYDLEALGQSAVAHVEALAEA